MMSFYGPYAGWGFLWMLLAWLIPLAIIGLIIWAIVRRPGGGTPLPAETGDDRALGLLRERYARGEITEEEYRRMRDVLKER
ncbi:MAG: SHOCT domain-containing protein [Clostridia bacterium]|nr:SHOCT domain-containing protein [Clostridia bacterium]MCL6522466.1 SHOCT domain-containing protein [Bacillota bacterium]